MEVYAVNRLTNVFDEYNSQEPQNRLLAETIVNALIKKTIKYEKFKLCFWKILWNLHIKGKERSSRTLDDLFNGRWSSVDDFINATDDELDRDCEKFRQNIRLKEFRKMENSKRINAMFDDDYVKNTGLICSKCKSNNTDYSLMQTRSGDEGSTIFAFCKNCGKRWKFSG